MSTTLKPDEFLRDFHYQTTNLDSLFGPVATGPYGGENRRWAKYAESGTFRWAKLTLDNGWRLCVSLLANKAWKFQHVNVYLVNPDDENYGFSLGGAYAVYSTDPRSSRLLLTAIRSLRSRLMDPQCWGNTNYPLVGPMHAITEDVFRPVSKWVVQHSPEPEVGDEYNGFLAGGDNVGHDDAGGGDVEESTANRVVTLLLEDNDEISTEEFMDSLKIRWVLKPDYKGFSSTADRRCRFSPEHGPWLFQQGGHIFPGQTLGLTYAMGENVAKNWCAYFNFIQRELPFDISTYPTLKDWIMAAEGAGIGNRWRAREEG